MIKLPVKDPDTVPWMSKREIPAIKAILSAWRKYRRDKVNVEASKLYVRAMPLEQLSEHAELNARRIAGLLEELAAIDARLRNEAKNGHA